MATLLLILIYICFISLGLPDSLLGAAWPDMHAALGADVSWAGAVTLLVTCCTVVSSLLSTRLIRRFGTGAVSAVSVAMTAAGLFGIAATGSIWFLFVCAVPLGLGGGSVDAALNNYVALHYEARHMNWLHCAWGVGATAGPSVISFWLTRGATFRTGYVSIAVFQSALVLVLVLTLPLWKKAAEQTRPEDASAPQTALKLRDAVRLPGAKGILTALFCYCGLEYAAGLWGGSYASVRYGVTAETAAAWTALFYFGITAGRFVCGFATMKIKNRTIIRMGQGAIFLGAAMLLLPLGMWKVPAALTLIGLGCAPIYPGLLHQTPENFGPTVSQAMMGVQMAAAYIGSTLLPPLLGLLFGRVSMGLFPAALLTLIAVMALCTERAARRRNDVLSGKE